MRSVSSSSVPFPRHVHVVKGPKGKLYHYWAPHRGTARAEPRIRLPSDPSSPEFWAEIKRLSGSDPRSPSGSIGELVSRYRDSRDYLQLSPSTQKTYKVHLDRLANPDVWGLAPARELSTQLVYELRETMADTPVMANHFLGFGRTLWDWGASHGFLPRHLPNPFVGVKLLRIEERGHIPWEPWVVDYVTTHAPEDLARFVKLAFWSGQRESDVVRFGPQNFEQVGLWCRPEKTKQKRKGFFIRLKAPEIDELNRWATTPMSFTSSRWKKPIPRFRDDLYLYTPKGQPYTPTRLRRRWTFWLTMTDEGRELCRRWKVWVRDQVRRYGWNHDPEEMRGPTLHGLRGGAVRRRRLEGSEAQAISNDIGMSLPMVAHYTRFIDQMHAAESNARRLEAA